MFKNEYLDENEYIKYNLLAYKLSLNKSVEELRTYLDGDNYYLTESIETMLEFIEKLIFDFNSIYKGNCDRRKRVMPGMELLPLYEETIRGYVTSDFSRPAISIFILRQIIELKIKRTLGFICAIDNTSKEEKIISLSDLFEYIREKESQKQIISPVDIELLIEINKATNLYIHTGNFINIMSWHQKIGQLILRELCFKRNDKKTHVEGSFIMLKSLYLNLENDLSSFLGKKNIKLLLEKPEVTIEDTI